MRRTTLIGSLLLSAALLGSPAGAQEPGVHVDPNSPAGQEYQVPIDAARRDARGGGPGGVAGTAGTVPSFGAGIAPKSSSSSDVSNAAGGNTGGSQRKADSERRATGDGGGEDGFRAVRNASVDSDGLDPSLGVALIALAVLALGGAAGFAARRASRSGS